MDISECRQQIYNLNKERLKLFKIIMDSKKLMKGTLVKINRNCGNQNCKCIKKGELHPAWYLSFKISGKTTMKYIKKSDYVRTKILSDNYRRFRKTREKIVKLDKKIINYINKFEKLKTIGDNSVKKTKKSKEKKGRAKPKKKNRTSSSKKKK